MLTAPLADDASAQMDGTRNMNGKLRVAAVSAALVVLAGLVLLIVRPSLDPARMRPLPLIAGAWMVFDALRDDVFHPDPDDLWRLVLRRQRGRVSWLANAPDDLSMN